MYSELPLSLYELISVFSWGVLLLVMMHRQFGIVCVSDDVCVVL